MRKLNYWRTVRWSWLSLVAVVCLSISCAKKDPQSDKSPQKGEPEQAKVDRSSTPFGFSLEVPADWETREEGAVFVSPVEGADDTFRENLGIAKKTTPDTTLAGFASKYFDSIKGDPDMSRESVESTKVLGRDARFSIAKSERLKRSYAQWVFMQKSGEFIVFTATIPNESLPKYLPIFRRVVESAKAQ